jgi:transcriptional regulator with XRE-family HTH domain
MELQRKDLRMDRGWTQEELAHRSGLNRSYMGDVERGRSDVSLCEVVIRLRERLFPVRIMIQLGFLV